MNHPRAIAINQTALRLVVEEIFALLEIVLDGTALRLPMALQQAAYRLLVPAESALRRLIVIAARGLKVKLRQAKSKPPVSHITAKGNRPLAFQLFDPRKRFDRLRKTPKSITPRIHFFDGPKMFTIAALKVKKQLTSTHIFRRFEAFKLALENIPREAKRMAHWQARRAAKIKVKFRDPLRPGAPPGFHRNLVCDVDRILKECHGLAYDALRQAPS